MQNDKEDWVHFTAVVKETAAAEKNSFFPKLTFLYLQIITKLRLSYKKKLGKVPKRKSIFLFPTTAL